MQRRHSWALAALVLAASCTAPEPETATEIIVEIDAEPGVREMAASLRVLVEGNDGVEDLTDRTERLDETVKPIEFPSRIALVPLNGDDTRAFVLTATALDGDKQFIAEARVISGYVPGEVRYARLLIEDACIGMDGCEPLQTCTRAECVSARVDQDELSKDSERPTLLTPYALLDAGMDGGVTPDAGVDSGVTPDAGVDAGSDPCATDHGGCDPLVSCTNSAGAAPTCGACPSGYMGSGEAACTPTLTALSLSSGVLSPAFGLATSSYTASLGLGTPTLSFTPSVPAGASVSVSPANELTPGTWQSPVLNLGDTVFTLTVSQAGQPSRMYTITITRGLATEAYLKASNTEANDSFGDNVALSADGNTLAVSARYEDSSGTGVNPNTQADNSATESGAVYVFSRSGSTWSQQAYLKASNAEADDFFGSLALSADGNTLAVSAGEGSNGSGVNPNTQADNSAPGSGAVYVFSRSGSTWSHQAYLKASNTEANDSFGYAVALSADGNTLAVGARGEDSNGTGVNPNTQADNSAPGSGAVYVFSRSGSTWSQPAYIKASNTGQSDLFGSAVALSADGDTLAVGAIYEASSGTGVNPNSQADNSAADSGAVYVFSRSGSTWSHQAYVKASNTGQGDYFGFAVALSADGNTLAVGALWENSNGTGVNPNAQTDNSAADSGAAYVFSRSGSTWSQQAYIKASNTGQSDYFGHAVALSADGDTLAVGAIYEESNGTGINPNTQADNSAPGSGAVYAFARSGSTWSQEAYLKAFNTETNDNFGSAVALSADGNTLALGAPRESSNGTGVNPNTQADNSAPESGAVYVFR